MAEPHYVRGYRKFTEMLSKRYNEDCAALLAVGGGVYEEQGASLRRILVGAGLKSGDAVIDVGCGSGRLSWALSQSQLQIEYIGTDVVPALLEYARRRCENPSFKFIPVEGLYIPAENKSADVVTFFSVLTHLNPPEQFEYLREARRVLKPEGIIIASYIELWRMPLVDRARFCVSAVNYWLFHRYFKSVTSSDNQMRAFGDKLGMTSCFLGPVIGQSVCVYRL